MQWKWGPQARGLYVFVLGVCGVECFGAQPPNTDPSLRLTNKASWNPTKNAPPPLPQDSLEGVENIYPSTRSPVPASPRHAGYPPSVAGHPGPPPLMETAVRSVYLNGVNIGSVKNQKLENVTVQIDGAGHIHITAPHYEAQMESTYYPLLPGPNALSPRGPLGVEGPAKNEYPTREKPREATTPAPPQPPKTPVPLGPKKEEL